MGHSNQLRFFIDTSREPVEITDNGKPTEFTLPNLPADRRTTGDYAIVSEALHGAPAGWQSRNLQLMLHVKVISGTPSSPKVVKTHFG